MVSVIIPVYNVLPYLKESIDSVINQTYKDIEIIIVDDGSDDGSESVCDKYKKDSRIKVLHQKNQGLSSARNAGLDIASGDYIAFLDSDDVYLPDMIQTMVETIERIKVDIVVCGVDIVYSKKNMEKSKRKHKRGFYVKEERTITREDAVKLVSDKIMICVWNKLYKKELWNDLRFPNGKVFEDSWILPQLLEKTNRIHLIPQVLVKYRKRPYSITSTLSCQNIEDRINAKISLEEYVNKYAINVSDKSDFYRFYEDNARLLTISYAELIRLKGRTEYTRKLKEELLNKWKSLDGNIVKSRSKIACFLLKNIPSLLLPASKIAAISKRF